MNIECKNTSCPFCGGCKAETTCNNFMAEEPQGTFATTTTVLNGTEYTYANIEDVTPIPKWIVKSTVTEAIPEKLSTAEEYRKGALPNYDQISMFSKPKYICPKCGGGMCKNNMVVLTSYPVQFEYQCDKCGNIEYQYK